MVTRLQLLNDNYGLDLTYATLAAMLKYPTGSDKTDDSIAARKKHGYFFSEEKIAKQVFEKTGLAEGVRHPLTYVMEACDDIAYVVLDVEDAVKKGLASFEDLMGYLAHFGGSDTVVSQVVEKSRAKHKEYREQSDLSPYELNDVSMQRFRVFAIGALVRAAVTAFVERQKDIVAGTLDKPLMKISIGEKLRAGLKEFGFKHAYTHRSVLKIELEGYNCIRRLMDIFWDSIENRVDDHNLSSKRKHPFSRFVYGRISENYRRIFEQPTDDAKSLPTRYREFQLLTDMISGMTDSYAMNLRAELDSLIGEYKLIHCRQ